MTRPLVVAALAVAGLGAASAAFAGPWVAVGAGLAASVVLAVAALRAEARAEREARARAAAEEARAASEAASVAFLRETTHDLRNALNPIVGMTGILRDGPLDEEQRDCVETIRSGVENLKKVAERMTARRTADAPGPAAPGAPVTAPPPPAPGAAPAPAPGAAPRVLLGEDDPVSRRATLLTLERLGVRADAAADGREALDAVRARDYDVVFLDVHMPELDGLAVAREVRRAPPRGRAPRLVALTGSATPEDRAACLAAGMDDCLVKPVDADGLRAALGIAAPAVTDVRSLRTADGRAAADVLVDLYLDDAPTQIARLRAAAAAGDAKAMEETAHRLRGSSASVGARGIAERAAEVETLARSGAVAAARRAFEALEAAWPAERAALRRGDGPGS